MNAAQLNLPPPWLAFEFMLASLAAGISVLAATTPVGNDILAVVGAILATFIVVIDARKSDASKANTISVVIGSAAVGSLAPGVLCYNIWPNLASKFTWHVWASLGFLAGLMGWSIVWGFARFIQGRKMALFHALERRYIGTAYPPPKEPPDVEDNVPLR